MVASHAHTLYMHAGLHCSLCNLKLALESQPSVQSIAAALFLATVGFMMSDVTTDAIIVERSKHEAEEDRGSMQVMQQHMLLAPVN